MSSSGSQNLLFPLASLRFHGGANLSIGFCGADLTTLNVPPHEAFLGNRSDKEGKAPQDEHRKDTVMRPYAIVNATAVNTNRLCSSKDAVSG